MSDVSDTLENHVSLRHYAFDHGDRLFAVWGGAS